MWSDWLNNILKMILEIAIQYLIGMNFFWRNNVPCAFQGT